MAFSTSAEPVAARLMSLIGVGEDPRFSTAAGRIANRESVEEALGDWIGRHTADEVLELCAEADVAAAPVLLMTELVRDPQMLARRSLVEVDGVVMPGPAARLSATPGQVRWAGPARAAGEVDVAWR